MFYMPQSGYNIIRVTELVVIFDLAFQPVICVGIAFDFQPDNALRKNHDNIGTRTAHIQFLKNTGFAEAFLQIIKKRLAYIFIV